MYIFEIAKYKNNLQNISEIMKALNYYSNLEPSEDVIVMQD